MHARCRRITSLIIRERDKERKRDIFAKEKHRCRLLVRYLVLFKRELHKFSTPLSILFFFFANIGTLPCQSASDGRRRRGRSHEKAHPSQSWLCSPSLLQRQLVSVSSLARTRKRKGTKHRRDFNPQTLSLWCIARLQVYRPDRTAEWLIDPTAEIPLSTI